MTPTAHCAITYSVPALILPPAEYRAARSRCWARIARAAELSDLQEQAWCLKLQGADTHRIAARLVRWGTLPAAVATKRRTESQAQEEQRRTIRQAIRQAESLLRKLFPAAGVSTEEFLRAVLNAHRNKGEGTLIEGFVDERGVWVEWDGSIDTTAPAITVHPKLLSAHDVQRKRVGTCELLAGGW